MSPATNPATAAPINFTATLDLLTSNGHDAANPHNVLWAGMPGQVIISPCFADYRPVLAENYPPRPAAFVIREFVGTIKPDGRLYDEAGNLGIRLPANDPIFGLDHLIYHVRYDLAPPDGLGGHVRVDGGYFRAPTTDKEISLAVEMTSTGSASNTIKGTEGPAGPPNELRIGSVASGASPGVTITGSSPSQTLNFVLPKGDTGPANSLSVGVVNQGANAAATITGTAPSQTLNLTLPKGDAGPVNSLAIGTVVSGTSAAATITGTAPSQTLNLTLPKGDAGASTADATVAAPDRPTPADGDRLPVVASGVSTLSRISWATIKSALLAYISTAVATFTNKTLTAPTINNGVLVSPTCATLAGATKNASTEALGSPGGVTLLTTSTAGGLSESTAIIPALQNSLAFLPLYGGTVSCTVNGAPVTPATINRMFEVNRASTDITTAAATDVVVIEVDFSYRPITAQSVIGMDSRQSGAARNVTIEMWNGSAWVTAGSIADNQRGYFAVISPGASFTKARFTCTNLVNGTRLSIIKLFLYQAWNDGREPAAVMTRACGTVVGTADRPPTLNVAGPDSSIPFAINPKNSDLLINSGGIISPAMSLVPAPPATATAAGRRGQTALSTDGNTLFVCVTTGAAGAALWRRVALTAF